MYASYGTAVTASIAWVIGNSHPDQHLLLDGRWRAVTLTAPPVEHPESRPAPRLGRAQRVAAIALALVVVLAAAVGFVLTRDSDGPSITYASAQAMAEKAGCEETFQSSTAYAGIVSAGTCSVNGQEVIFRVLPNTDAAYGWADGARKDADQPHGHTGVGEGWVAFSMDLDAVNTVSVALTTP
jgi:hypothetical protein